MNINIRLECPEDRDAIFDLTKRAFAPMPYADGDEQEMIDKLRDAGALSLSAVAVLDGAIAGHVALSPATHEGGDAGWYTLGPISAEPALQRKGIGRALIAFAKSWMGEHRARGCILTGNPNYYSRFGFVPAPGSTPAGAPPAFFMVLPLNGACPPGRFRFHPVFGA
ncbi:MAG: N-acetyltransferase [Alphaproteobacteria bacterium]|nr:N-acetyltransferase [Alphaproteobacteria bacterium]